MVMAMPGAPMLVVVKPSMVAECQQGSHDVDASMLVDRGRNCS
jgi:hypothetical protein